MVILESICCQTSPFNKGTWTIFNAWPLAFAASFGLACALSYELWRCGIDFWHTIQYIILCIYLYIHIHIICSYNIFIYSYRRLRNSICKNRSLRLRCHGLGSCLRLVSSISSMALWEEKSSKKRSNSCLRLLGCSFRGCRFWPGVPQSFAQSASGHTMQHTLLKFPFLGSPPKSHLQCSLHPLPETFDMTTKGSANFKTQKVKPSNNFIMFLICHAVYAFYRHFSFFLMGITRTQPRLDVGDSQACLLCSAALSTLGPFGGCIWTWHETARFGGQVSHLSCLDSVFSSEAKAPSSSAYKFGRDSKKGHNDHNDFQWAHGSNKT